MTPIITPTNELFFYLRIIVFPLCSLGFIVSAIYEYQTGKSKMRLAIMLTTAISMFVWMTLTIAAVYQPGLMDFIRAYGVTPIITLLTVLIWSYAIVRTRHHD